ncbi:hypothetical protein L228DRAFT_16288 [Xylona heveae TC161]|uniref:Uncharacterized protein n=1 Tax=Xylona heveae (strain CBS 132557 / TC161) TaxID=1328760 RepID=A0A165JUK6_XYLHT|nr:hypothetical protein L228DRAFT_16288 [Xylona heveae TC161]KZF26648.1 hypothetical protein L228DRAFT_16288 [Xylona heveae TC161]
MALRLSLLSATVSSVYRPDGRNYSLITCSSLAHNCKIINPLLRPLAVAIDLIGNSASAVGSPDLAIRRFPGRNLRQFSPSLASPFFAPSPRVSNAKSGAVNSSWW